MTQSSFDVRNYINEWSVPEILAAMSVKILSKTEKKLVFSNLKMSIGYSS